MKKSVFILAIVILSTGLMSKAMRDGESMNIDDAPGMGKHVQNNTEFEFNEFMPWVLPTQVAITFMERADISLEDKLDLLFDNGIKVIVGCCSKAKNWFMQN